MSIAAAFLSFKIIRGLPLFALIFLPAVTANLNDTYLRLKKILEVRWSQIYKLISYLAPIALAILIILGTFTWRYKITPYQNFGIGISDTSEEPVNFFKDNGLRGPILNDTDIGSYLIYYLYPQEKVFADNRFADAYTREFLEDEYAGLFGDESIWQKMLKKYDFNTIFLNHYNRGNSIPDFIYRRFYDPEWAMVYAGRDVLIFIKNIPENQSVIETYGINENNLPDKLTEMAQAPDYQANIAAADIFGYVGRVGNAKYEYERVVAKWPYLGRVWYVIGKNELMRGDQINADTALALIALKNAVKYGYKTPMSYSYLALAYYRMGDTENAQKAVDKELKLDPDNEDAATWLEIFRKDRLKAGYGNEKGNE
jgi:tetratricopeptide (TPR) repeat protein